MTEEGRGSRIRTVLLAFESARLGWCVLRGAESIEEGGHDLDLLLDEQSLEPALRRLNALGWTVTERGRRRAELSHKHDTGARIDLALELAFGRLRLPVGDVLSRSSFDDGLRRPQLDDEFWLLLLHTLLDHGRVRPGHAQRLRTLAADARPDSPMSAAVFRRAPQWKSATVIELALAGEWEELSRFAGQAAGTSALWRSAGRFAHRLSRRVRRPLRRRSGRSA